MGVIGVALFRERQSPSVWVPPRPPVQSEAPVAEERDGVARPSRHPRLHRRVRRPGPIRTLAERPFGQGRFALGGVAPFPSPAPQAKLGTGHGEREYSYVSHTEFARLQLQPNEIIRIRYDSFENLLAMGIVVSGRARSPRR